MNLSTAELIGTFLEVLGFGFYLVVGPQAFLILHQKRLPRELMIYLFSTMIITFTLIISHLVIDVVRAFIAFTAHTDIPNAPETYYSDLSSALCIAKASAVAATTLVADALLVYRTMVIWGRKWWALAIPAALYLLDIAALIWFIWTLKETKADFRITDSAAFARSIYFFAATLAVNLICTCLIAYKIWRVQNEVAIYVTSDSRVRNAFSIILESAAIYTAILVCMIVLVCVRSTALFIFLNSMSPLIGLVFTYVILRSTSDKSYEVWNISMPRFVVDSENIKMKPTNPTSEGVRIHLERVVHRG
ncbi:hypothetical protein AX15_004303 [Amanita polypyramis BW_CC]|nr:hypothetical protein AX15_004303 [Amanita polypyramis BW_CC]